jgi:hypothetical protein
MRELIGQKCAIIFNLPATEWPIPGYPAWATVEDVDMPMVKADGLWFNCAIVKTIRISGPRREPPPWWARFLSGPP